MEWLSGPIDVAVELGSANAIRIHLIVLGLYLWALLIIIHIEELIQFFGII